MNVLWLLSNLQAFLCAKKCVYRATCTLLVGIPLQKVFILILNKYDIKDRKTINVLLKLKL